MGARGTYEARPDYSFVIDSQGDESQLVQDIALLAYAHRHDDGPLGDAARQLIEHLKIKTRRAYAHT